MHLQPFMQKVIKKKIELTNEFILSSIKNISKDLSDPNIQIVTNDMDETWVEYRGIKVSAILGFKNTFDEENSRIVLTKTLRLSDEISIQEDIKEDEFNQE